MSTTNGIKVNDRIILMLLSGSISAAIANTFGYFTKWLYPPTVVMPEAAIQLFVPPNAFHNILGFVFANLMSFVVGGIHAVLFVIILDITGWRYFWLKSFAVTTMGWFMVVGILFTALGVSKPTLLSSILFFGAHLVYLTVSAFIVSRIGVPKVIRVNSMIVGKEVEKKQIRKYSIVPAPAMKKERGKKVRLVKPKKSHNEIE